MNKGNKKIRLVIICAVAVFVVAMGAWIGSLGAKNAKLKKELEAKQDELAAWQEENAALDALVDEENETALMEEYARKAGYVYPDERVYIQGN